MSKKSHTDPAAGSAAPKRHRGNQATKKIHHEMSSLAVDFDDEQMQRQLAEIADAADALDPQQREQLEEIARLNAVMGEGDAIQLNQDGVFELVPDDDRMHLTLSITPPLGNGKPVRTAAIVSELKSRGIRRGIDLARIQESVYRAGEGEQVDDQIIVTGRPPVPGRDERLEFFARPKSLAKLAKINPDCFEDTNPLFCQARDRIARRVPAQPGKDGYNALGQPIPASEPTRAALVAGPNTELEGHDVFATTDGVVIFDGRKIEVRRLLIFTEDVSADAGFIDFDGDVQVRAAVRTGASIRATGDVMVDGLVEAAAVRSTGGRITLRHGVAGRHKAIIHADRDIKARYTENASIFAGRDINIEVGALHCHLVAGRSIRLNRGRGRLQGGIAVARQSIEVQHVGTPQELPTRLTVGIPEPVLKKLTEIDQETHRKMGQVRRCTDLADQMKRLVGDPAKLKPEELKTYTRLRQIQVVTEHQITRLREQRQATLEAAETADNAEIAVGMKMHPGVSIHFGPAHHAVTKNHGPCRIMFEPRNAKIKFRRIKP